MSEQSHKCVLEAESFRIECDLQQRARDGFIFTQYALVLNPPRPRIACLNISGGGGIQVADWMRLINYLQQHVKDVREGVEKTFLYLDLEMHFFLEGLAGEVDETETDGSFILRISFPGSKPPWIRFGVESYISFSNVERFIAELTAALADLK